MKNFPQKVTQVLQINNLFQMLFAKQIKLSIHSSPDMENENKGENQNKEFIKTSDENRFESNTSNSD